VPNLVDVVEDGGKPAFLLRHGDVLEIVKELPVSEQTIYVPPSKVLWPMPSSKAVELVKEDSDEALFLDLLRYFAEHLELYDWRQYVILALWTMMTWVYDRFDKLPYIFFVGPPATGKTRAQEILRLLCWRPMHTTVMTEATIFRSAEFLKPTLLVDEVVFYDREKQAGVISVLNARHDRNMLVPRVDKDRSGPDSIQGFSVFGPTCFAGTEDLTPTLRMRSIVFAMKGMTTRGRRVIRRHLDEGRALELRTRLLAFKLRHWDDEFRGEEELQVLQESRHEDLFAPLYAIAERVGGEENPIMPIIRHFGELPRALKREGKLVKGIIYNRELLELWAKRFGIDIQAKLELGKTPEGEGWVPCLFKEDLPEMSVLDPKTGYARAVGPFVKGQVSALPRPSAELLRQRKVVDILEGKNNQG